MLSQSIREEFFCLAITFRTRRAFGRHPGRQALRLQLFGGEIRRPGESASESAVMPATKNRLITITHKLLLERKSFPASWRLIIRRSFQITSLAFSPLSRRTFGWKVSGRLTTSVLRPFGSLCFFSCPKCLEFSQSAVLQTAVDDRYYIDDVGAAARRASAIKIAARWISS